jgi:hypothetical protein
MAVINTVLMNSANPNSGTPLRRASSSRVLQASGDPSMEGTRWVSTQGLKLEAQDLLTKGSLALIAISEEESEGGGWW